MPTLVEPVKLDGVRYAPGDTITSEQAKQLPEGYALADAAAKKVLKEAVEADSSDDE